MKKILILCGVFFFAGQVHAQKGMEVTIKNFVPDQMRILPGVYEFFGEITKGGNGASYVLTTNEALVSALKDSAAKGKIIAFFGPKLETLAKNKCIRDYKDLRKQLTDSLVKIVQETKTELAKEDEYNEQQQLKKKLSADKKNLQKEKWNTFVYVMKLKKIVKRYDVNCIYAYNYSAGTAVSQAPEQKQQQFDRNKRLGIK